MLNQPLAQKIRALTAIKSVAIKLLGVACAFGTLLPSIAQAPADVRIALVIGNAAYPGTAALANPGNDAKAMGETLRGLGFTMVEARDASRAQIVQAIATVRDNLKGRQGVGMLYYAGHGLQLDWRNYMVPVDAKMSKAADVPEQAVDLGQVIDAFKAAGNKMNIVVLDACRDNPFAGTATGKGLAQLDAPPGTFLAYATAPGNVAEDGEAKADSNGLYTKFLLQELKKPQAKIEDVFKRVRLNVRQQSQGRKIPWESTSLEDDFFFDKGIQTAKRGQGESDAAYRMQLTLWESLKSTGTPDDLIEYLKAFPSGYFSELAQSRLDQISKVKIDTKAIGVSSTPNDSLVYTNFIGTTHEGQLEVKDNKRYAKFILKAEIIKIEDGIVYRKANRDAWGNPTDVMRTSDLMGNPISNADIQRTVAMQTHPAEYKIGYKWKYTDRHLSIGNARNHVTEYESRVVAKENVVTKFGTFEAYQIKTVGWRDDGGKNEITRWTIPGEIGTIKYMRRLYGRGELWYSEDYELINFKSGKPT